MTLPHEVSQERQRSEERTNARAVACPVPSCGALAGEECRDSLGRSQSAVHGLRTQRAGVTRRGQSFTPDVSVPAGKPRLKRVETLSKREAERLGLTRFHYVAPKAIPKGTRCEICGGPAYARRIHPTVT
jgi:hypothetical protein